MARRCHHEIELRISSNIRYAARQEQELLTAPGTPGTLVHCTEGSREKSRTVIHAQGEQILAAEMSGTISVYAASDCRAVPLSVATPSAGDTVHAYNWLGSVADVTISAVDQETDVLTATFDFVGEEKEVRLIQGEYEPR